MRQVTHALLTRPPLSHSSLRPEGFREKCFVRLACIKHAASVHPEPGSNSRIKCMLCSFPHHKAALALLYARLIQPPFNLGLKPSPGLLSFVLPSPFSWHAFWNSSWNFRDGICCSVINVLFLFAALSIGQLAYIITCPSDCQQLFLKNLKKIFGDNGEPFYSGIILSESSGLVILFICQGTVVRVFLPRTS